MNIFPLSHDFTESVKFHVDSHVIKIPLECAQMMSTACHHAGLQNVGYKSTHINHPTNKWVRECLENYKWMLEYSSALNEEYKYRYGKTVNHKAFDMILSLPIPNLPVYGKNTDIPLCMPEHCKIESDVVASYRKYYLQEKRHLWKWKNRPTPSWIMENF
jgi:hypothetical protein